LFDSGKPRLADWLTAKLVSAIVVAAPKITRAPDPRPQDHQWNTVSRRRISRTGPNGPLLERETSEIANGWIMFGRPNILQLQLVCGPNISPSIWAEVWPARSRLGKGWTRVEAAKSGKTGRQSGTPKGRHEKMARPATRFMRSREL